LKRNFLFLQGPSTPFFGELANRLRAEGHGVYKLNFNVGDKVYWYPNSAESFRDPLPELAFFLKDRYEALNITDQVLFGDRRPVHIPAIAAAESHNVRVHVFEEGYLRPYWVTLERGGVNARSLLPKNPVWYQTVSAHLRRTPANFAFESPFWRRAVHDVAYHSAGIFNPLLFPLYRTHSTISAPSEYVGFVAQFIKSRQSKRLNAEIFDRYVKKNTPFFLLPLQLSTDAQIRGHAVLNSTEKLIEYVIRSFARQASNTVRLLIKKHPLDAAITDYRNLICRLARELGCEHRIDFIDTGNLASLCQRALGVVSVNSTAGLVALEQGTPTLCLGNSIYNIHGLTTNLSIDQFWHAPQKPDAELMNDFRVVLLNTVLINGGFYCPQGIKLAVTNSHKILSENLSPLEYLLREFPV